MANVIRPLSKVPNIVQLCPISHYDFVSLLSGLKSRTWGYYLGLPEFLFKIKSPNPSKFTVKSCCFRFQVSFLILKCSHNIYWVSIPFKKRTQFNTYFGTWEWSIAAVSINVSTFVWLEWMLLTRYFCISCAFSLVEGLAFLIYDWCYSSCSLEEGGPRCKYFSTGGALN